MAALEAGLSFVMTHKAGEQLKPLYPVTKVANVREDDGTTLVELLAGKAATEHGNHVPVVETANNLKFLRCDNTWAEIQKASLDQFGVVKLTDATTLDDSTLAASAAAVKAAYDLANHAHPYIETSKMGVANGVATLDATGIIPAAQLPSFVDDVLEGKFVDSTHFQKADSEENYAGETGKIYVDTESGKTYRWSGSAFVVISETLALGVTASTAFRGDYGNAAYEHSLAAHARTDATLTEKSNQNGYIKINGTETLVYSHPTGTTETNPHGTTAEDVGLGKVQNMTAAEIIDTLTKGIIEEKFGGTIATTAIATSMNNGLMSTDHVKKLENCMRIYVQAGQPVEDGLWLRTEEAAAIA